VGRRLLDDKQIARLEKLYIDGYERCHIRQRFGVSDTQLDQIVARLRQRYREQGLPMPSARKS